jgi:hypothetical protein
MRPGDLWSTESLLVAALLVSLHKLALRTKSTLVFARHPLREEIGAGTTAIRAERSALSDHLLDLRPVLGAQVKRFQSTTGMSSLGAQLSQRSLSSQFIAGSAAGGSSRASSGGVTGASAKL